MLWSILYYVPYLLGRKPVYVQKKIKNILNGERILVHILNQNILLKMLMNKNPILTG